MRGRATIGAAIVAFAAAVGPAAPAAAAPACPPVLDKRSNLFESAGGPIDHRLHLRARGRVRAVMIFVDFPNARAESDTRSLFDFLAPGMARWYAEASYGRMSLSVTPVHRWFRMRKASTRYRYARGLTFAAHRRYLADAIRAADRRVNFRRYKIVYVVAAQAPGIPHSPTFHAFRGAGVRADRTEVRWAVTLGNDIHVPGWGYRVPVHETGHLFGLPDLYDLRSADFTDLLRFVGGWDVMSMNGTGAHFFAWSKARLGWLGRDQLRCVGRGSTEVTLAPLETRGGVKAVVLRTGRSRATVVEARRARGEDSTLCDEGVLVYKVDATVPTGRGPIRIVGGGNGTDEEQIARCGPRYDAGLDAGGVYEDATITVEVLASNPDGSFRVRVTGK